MYVEYKNAYAHRTHFPTFCQLGASFDNSIKVRVINTYLISGCYNMDLRQGTNSVTEITMIFTKRALFFLELAVSEQAQMTQYLSMLKMDIR